MVHERYAFYLVLGVCFTTLFCCCDCTAYAECTYTAGHADMRISYVDDVLSLSLGVDQLTTLICDPPQPPLPPGTTLLDPSEYVIFVPESTAQVRDAFPAWDIVGVEEGETFYRLPEGGIPAQIEGAPFLGLSTEDVSGGVFVGNEIMLALTDVISAPQDGEFALYSGDVAPFREMDTQDGSFDNDSVPLPTGIHDHRNWSFSKPGRYQLEFTVSGSLIGETEPTTASAVFTFQVTPVPESSTAALALVVAALLIVHSVRRVRRGRPA